MSMNEVNIIAIGLPIIALNEWELYGEDGFYNFFEDEEKSGKLEPIYDINGTHYIGLIIEEHQVGPSMINFQSLDFYREDFVKQFKKYFNKTVSIEKVGLIYGTFRR